MRLNDIFGYVIIYKYFTSMPKDWRRIFTALSFSCSVPLWRGTEGQSLSAVIVRCQVFSFPPHFTRHTFHVYRIHARPSQPRLSTADHAPPFVAYTTTAVQTLERSYDWRPPSLILLNCIWRGSPWPILRTFLINYLAKAKFLRTKSRHSTEEV
jgi:hypothetical protein